MCITPVAAALFAITFSLLAQAQGGTVGFNVGPSAATLRYSNDLMMDDCLRLSLDCIDHSPTGKFIALAVSADNSTVYAAAYSGVWHSRGGGALWVQLQRPEPPGLDDDPKGLPVPNVYDLAVSPTNSDVVFAATAKDSRTSPRLT